MSLMPPTPPSEGGMPQSQKKPGDPERELIHEVRNLAASVALLNKTYLKKEDFDRRARVMYWISGIAAFLVITAIGSLFALEIVSNNHQNALVQRLTGNCQSRNSQSEATTNLINGLLGINAEAGQLNPHPSPVQRHITLEYIGLLKHYENQQAKPVNCQALK